jgi:hypothetical protein
MREANRSQVGRDRAAIQVSATRNIRRVWPEVEMVSDRLGGRRAETPAKLLKRLVFHTRLIRNPVHFPALAPISGEGPFEVSGNFGG